MWGGSCGGKGRGRLCGGCGGWGAFLGCGGGFLGGWEGWGRGGEKVRRGEAGGMRFLGAAVAVRFWWCVVVAAQFSYMGGGVDGEEVE